MTEMDLIALEEKWLQQCGPCDGGLPMGCACPNEDPRPVIMALIQRIRVAESAATDGAA